MTFSISVFGMLVTRKLTNVSIVRVVVALTILPIMCRMALVISLTQQLVWLLTSCLSKLRINVVRCGLLWQKKNMKMTSKASLRTLLLTRVSCVSN